MRHRSGVDREHNAPGTPILKVDSMRAAFEAEVLWKPQHVSAAIQYVVAQQGEPMSVFESHEL
ncbi:MAG: hypothetical protein P4L56_08180 [Candidatus Sulfopaludibacter sp.]|nr:hypothetical protein [Candidatus Sulfopaludibacter sp.]